MIREYTPREVAELLAQGGELQLIDVREAHEHAAGHIAGSRWVRLSELPAQAATIGRDVPVILYCRSGGRSAMATQALMQAGYDAYNMAGGMLEWEAARLELEPPGGYVAEP